MCLGRFKASRIATRNEIPMRLAVWQEKEIIGRDDHENRNPLEIY